MAACQLDLWIMAARHVGRLPGPLTDQHGFGRRGIPTDLLFDHCIIIQAKDEC